MKKLFPKTFALLCVTLFGVSCNVQDDTAPDSDFEIATCNPYDFIGEFHNQGLDYVFNNLPTTKTSSISVESIDYLSTSFCQEIFSKDSRFEIPDITKSDGAEYEGTIELSQVANHFYDRIIDIVQTSDYNYIKDQLILIESEIANSDNNEISEYDEAFLLCSIAVAKFSNEYWEEHLEKTKGLIASCVLGDLVGAGRGIAAHAVEIVICGAIGGPGCGIAAAGRAALGPAIGHSVLAGLTYAAAQL